MRLGPAHHCFHLGRGCAPLSPQAAPDGATLPTTQSLHISRGPCCITRPWDSPEDVGGQGSVHPVGPCRRSSGGGRAGGWA